MQSRGRGRGGVWTRGGRGGGSFSNRDRPPTTTSAKRTSFPPKLRPSDEETADGDRTHRTNGAAVSNSSAAAHNVVTGVTASGTELPLRLNNKVFVDGLPYNNSRGDGESSVEEELLQFAAAWRVGRPIRLIKKDGQGFGFLVLRSPHSVEVAVRVLNGRKFLGRALRVEVPKPKDMAGGTAAAGQGATDAEADDGKSSFARQVLLSDLAKVAQPEIIREILRDVAPAMEKRLESVKMTSRNRKAFLTFAAAADVDAAIGFLDGFMMLGRRITAARAAAPGSLPFSKNPTARRVVVADDAGSRANNYNSIGNGTTESAHDAEREYNADDEGEEKEEEEEEVVLPLGMEKAPAARNGAKARKAVAAASSSSSNALGERGRSNVTGVTEKYNLLDTGASEIFVGNLGEEITEEQLRAHFTSCGRITECEVIVNKSTRLPTGIARVAFALPAYAAYAQERFHGSRLRGHILRVDRGDEASAPLASELAPRGEEEEFDEDAYMEHYGVKDKEAYFKGTSLEIKQSATSSAKKTKKAASEAVVKSKRRRETQQGDNKEEESAEENTFGKQTRKRAKKDETAFAVSASIPMSGSGGGGDDSDEEEHFHDVDNVSVPVTTAVGTARTKTAAKAKKVTKAQTVAKKGKGKLSKNL